MTEFQFEILEVVELRRPPSRLARLGDAVARFLGKMAFFATMFGIGAAVMVWLPPVSDRPVPTLGDVVNVCVAFCALIMCGLSLGGLGWTVLTAGQKPFWD